MNEKEVNKLLQTLCKEYNVPMPVYFFVDVKPVVKEHQMKNGETVKFTYRMYSSHFMCFDAFDSSGLIFLARTRRGIRRDSVVHEFFHYLDSLLGKDVDEKSTRSRTRKWLKTHVHPKKRTQLTSEHQVKVTELLSAEDLEKLKVELNSHSYGGE